MPFPLLSLPYGFQQRLRQLATPREAYYLQLAAGFEKDVHLLPIQTFKVFQRQTISIKPGLITIVGFNPADTKQPLMLKMCKVNFKNIRPTDLNTISFDNMILQVEAVSMDSCTIDAPFVRKMVDHGFANIKRIEISSSKMLVSSTDLFTHFGSLQSATLCDSSNFGLLVTYLLHNNYTGLRTIDFLSFQEEHLYTVKPAELLQLIKRNEMVLHLGLHVVHKSKKMVDFLAPHFNEVRPFLVQHDIWWNTIEETSQGYERKSVLLACA